jgi:ribulose-5-phosphate 4-epimerase/fuculose-1-phosphate aldolase
LAKEYKGVAKSTYEVIQCPVGYQALQNALNQMADEPGDVISVLPDHGLAAFGETSGNTRGYLIVFRRTA